MAEVLISVAVSAAFSAAAYLLTPSQNFQREGPRLRDFQISTSIEGAAIPRLYGRMRMKGNMIWATRFLETATEETQESGGKGGPSSSVTTTTYTYSASFAFAFCEGGEEVQLGRVWADGKLLDLSKYETRFYKGTEDQLADSHMVAKEAEYGNKVSAYRGTTYIVFRDAVLTDFGNRIPSITAEVIKPIASTGPNELEQVLQSVCMIPATGEFAYGTTSYYLDDGEGSTNSMNTHNSDGIANVLKSINTLEDSAPNLGSVLLVVSWFSGDLRAGNADIKPKVEFRVRLDYSTDDANLHTIFAEAGDRVDVRNEEASQQLVEVLDAQDVSVAQLTVDPGETVSTTLPEAGVYSFSVVGSFGGANDPNGRVFVDVYGKNGVRPEDWKVSGVPRTSAEEVRRLDEVNDILAYGGTPSDRTVIELIQEMKLRGWRVVFYPFILMDQIEGNALPDPYGRAEQPPLPWRGRITCDPAAGEPSTADKTAAARTQVDAFFGTAQASDIDIDPADGLPRWNGAADEWQYRRMILHYAHLCEAADGVDAFLVGTEMVGLTTIRDQNGAYPAVEQFAQLAADVKGVLRAGTLVSYAADWSEYHSHRPDDGTGDVTFNMDQLWSSNSIDFIGIDNYLPMSDWRPSKFNHLDAQGPYESIYDVDYLKSNIEGGEYYDWFYASKADRDNQTRTNIVDPVYGKPWVYRQKDIRNWWLNAHRNRPGGTEQSGTTSWTAQSKPIWFTEFGCPAVNVGPNQPNVFFDTKSSESALPYYSTGRRDDLVQRRYHEAMLTYWRDNSPSGMIDPQNMFAWTWDARPFPEFPFRTDVWKDGENWRLGHWLTGRLGIVPLSKLVAQLVEEGGLVEGDYDVSGLFSSSAVVTGYVLDNLMSPRDAIEPLMSAYHFDGFETGGVLRFNLKENSPIVDIDIDDLVSDDSQNPGGYSLTRTQETELPNSLRLSFYDETRDYDAAEVQAKKITGKSDASTLLDIPIVFDEVYATTTADILMHQAWAGRDKAELMLPPSLFKVDPGDRLRITIKNREFDLRVMDIDTGYGSKVEAMSFDPSIYDGADYSVTSIGGTGYVNEYGPTRMFFADLPLLTGTEPNPQAPRIVAYQNPWPGSAVVYEDEGGSSYEFNSRVTQPSSIGRLTAPLKRGPLWVWDYANTISVNVFNGHQLISRSEDAVLAGKNSLAIHNPYLDLWEIVQFQDALLVEDGRYLLSKLLRGQLGTEQAMPDEYPLGSNAIFIEGSFPGSLDIDVNQLNIPINLRYGPGIVTVSDNRYQDVTVTPGGIGLTPFAPVGLSARGVPGGIELSWLRRTRFGGDNWENPVALNEEIEEYEVEVLDGSGTALVASTNSVVYETNDTPATISFRVYQMSSAVGRGRPGEGTVYVSYS